MHNIVHVKTANYKRLGTLTSIWVTKPYQDLNKAHTLTRASGKCYFLIISIEILNPKNAKASSEVSHTCHIRWILLFEFLYLIQTS